MRILRATGLTPPQAAVNDQQVVLAAEISNAAADFGHLGPMLDTTLQELREQGIDVAPEVVLADAGYWHTAQVQRIAEQRIEVLAPPDGNIREGKRPGWEAGFYERIREKMTTERGRKLYAQRKVTIEPVFGQIKYNRHTDRFMRRGRAAGEVSSFLSGWQAVSTRSGERIGEREPDIALAAAWRDHGYRPRNPSGPEAPGPSPSEAAG
jgi:Transposase DDE domain